MSIYSIIHFFLVLMILLIGWYIWVRSKNKGRK
jgi:hypothetical protein